MLRGTPLHSRTSALCEAQNWRRWSGYVVAGSYELSHEREYAAIRNSAALLDLSPLFKYHISGPDASRLLDRSLSYTEVESILNRLKSSPPIVVGTAQVLGYLDGSAVHFPRHAATPGSEVCLAPDELLRKFFSHNVAGGIEIGTLINRPTVPVLLNPNGLRRHLAVIAQTGAGKSYTVGVVLEKLVQLGGTVVVFDPNSDYVLMRRDKQHRATPFADRVNVFRLPTTQAGRIPDEEIGGSTSESSRNVQASSRSATCVYDRRRIPACNMAPVNRSSSTAR